MWERSYEYETNEVSKEQIWDTWSNINRWHEFDEGIDYARTSDEFKVGCRFKLKPKGGPIVTIEIIECEPGSHFTDLTCFPFAKMYGRHEMYENLDGTVTLKITMTVTGVLGFLWRKLVAQKIVDDLPADTLNLIDAAKKR
jgi:hypothetical protein